VARYADRLLADGERPILRTRQHLLAPIVEGRTAWAILLASGVLLALLGFSGLPQNELRIALGYLTLILLLVSIAWLGIVFIGWYSEDYMVTNRRVLKVDGILRKRSADSSLEKINDAILEQSVLGRLLDYGDLEILTAAETPVDHYSYLRGANNFKRVMLDAKHTLEQEVYEFPGPPLRADVAPQPSPAPAVAAAVAGNGASPRTMSSEEITRALGNLADLRDRGAISPEDYEAKKQDLLGRL
jgi:PH (Pleckstrin Homology) domain-containing protein/putative oligomerization/nucleic acid binding protein